jgi:hypothetical protein
MYEMHVSVLLNPFTSIVADPDPLDPYVFGPSGSGSASQTFGFGSFYHQAKLVYKTLDSYCFDFFLTFYLRKIM